jgi:hypothetical protein
MATYKVIQDVEAEDKLVGPLTLRQFIYAGIAALSGYLGFLSASKGAAFMLVIFAPVMFIMGFFAFPWGRDQPTEIWALAKIRFMIKPRKRIWDQSGTKDLVSVTAPKTVMRRQTNGLNQDEVRSRLGALSSTLDSRGWAVKNSHVNALQAAMLAPVETSDRLVQASSLPQQVRDIDVRDSDDILDAHANPVAQNFDTMIHASDAAHRQKLIDQMQQPEQPDTGLHRPSSWQNPGTTPDYWFMHQTQPVPGKATFTDEAVVTPGAQALPSAAPKAAVPTDEEKALVEKFKKENNSMAAAYGHMKVIKTPKQLAEEAKHPAPVEPPRAAPVVEKPEVTPEKQAAIMNLASTDDQDVATLARRARKEIEHQGDDGEVVISLR